MMARCISTGRPEIGRRFQQKRYLWMTLMTLSMCFNLVHPLKKKCPQMKLATAGIFDYIYRLMLRFNNTMSTHALIPERFYKPRFKIREIVWPNVPLRPPRLYFGSYESVIVSSPDNKNTRDVFIYWQNIDDSEKCGDVESFEYSAFYFLKTKHWRKTVVQSNFTYANHATFVGLKTNVAYKFMVYSTNVGGVSPDVSTIYVPSETDKNKPVKPIELTKTKARDGVYELSWTDADNQLTSADGRPNHYSLYWCENEVYTPNQCNGNMDSIMVPKSKLRFNVTVSDPTKNYQFAISANSRHMLVNDPYNGNQFTSISGGMVWESCQIRRNMRREIGIIKNVWASVVGSTYMGLRWKMDCVDRNGALKSYQVFYCPVYSVYHSECKDRTSPKITYGKVIQNHIPLIFLENLKPSTIYMISIEILTNIENWYSVNLRTDPLFQTTKPVDN